MAGKFDLGDYVEVKDRIKLFYELYAQGRLVTDEVIMHTAPDDRQRVMVKALAYRTPDDPHPGVGHSWMEIPGTTSYTKGSELENTETSAWGRAIASLGILVDRSIASAQEVQNKAGDVAAPPPPDGETETLVGDLKRTGTVKRGTAAKYRLEAREEPGGTHAIGFRLETKDGSIPQVAATGLLGESIYLAESMKPEALIGKRVTVKGRLYHVTRPGANSYYRLHLASIETPDYILPAPDEEEGPPDDVPLLGEEPVQPALLAV